MKYLKLTKQVALLAMLAFAFTACKKISTPEPLGDAGQTLVKLLGGGTPAKKSAKPIDFLPTPTRIIAVEVRRDIPNETELNKTMVVTVKDDTAAVRAFNPAYIQLPAAWYTIQTDGVKTGGQGGTYTLTFKPGQFSITINIIITDPTVMNPSALYGLGFTLLTADAGGKISTQKSIVVEIGAKNAYDGIYSVESGWVQRYTGPGSPEAITVGGLNGDLAGNADVIMSTVGAYTVSIPPSSGGAGRLAWAFGSNSVVAGIDGVTLTVNPVTNLVTAASATNATFGNWPGHVNDYNPATKTFRLAFKWTSTAPAYREYEIVLKYKGPR